MQEKDAMLTFLQTLTPRVGPVNAMNLAKDAHIGAFVDLFKSVGVPEAQVNKTIARHLQQTAQNVLNNVPTPSLLQRIS